MSKWLKTLCISWNRWKNYIYLKGECLRPFINQDMSYGYEKKPTNTDKTKKQKRKKNNKGRQNTWTQLKFTKSFLQSHKNYWVFSENKLYLNSGSFSHNCELSIIEQWIENFVSNFHQTFRAFLSRHSCFFPCFQTMWSWTRSFGSGHIDFPSGTSTWVSRNYQELSRMTENTFAPVIMSFFCVIHNCVFSSQILVTLNRGIVRS